MSLFAVQTPFSILKPKVWVVGPHLYARTSYPVQVLTLFAYCRSLHVDGERRAIELETVQLWALRRRVEIPFERVAYIDTHYRDVGTSWGWTDTGPGRTDKWENYSVSLVLRNPPDRLKLFNFCGDGAVLTGATGVLFGGDNLVDSYGEQADHFAFFLGHLESLLGVPVGAANDLPIKDELGLRYLCSVCRHPSIPGREKCWMCGGPVVPAIPTDSEPADTTTEETTGTTVASAGDAIP